MTNRINYEEVDVNDKSTIKAYFPKDEIGNEMFECVQSLPPRFRKDALDLFCDADDRDMWTMRVVDKAWCYFLDDVVPEMTEKEKEEYFFG